ncbi:Putative amino acid ABC tansporter permease protein (plasmid) [Priestia megaterium]|nr:Putative amino acid ABC tansporter permease protein [Priestia megaterium]
MRAYLAETFRAGIKSIPKGQMEAAKAIGMNYSLSMRRIILPQAIKNVIPDRKFSYCINQKLFISSSYYRDRVNA